MKKVLSLVLALTLVLGMIPVFAAETGTDKLVAAGFVNGNNPEDVLTREQLAVLVTQLNGEEAVAEAVAWVAPLSFADADKITWSKGYVGYAVAEGWMTGKTGNMFDPQAPATPQQVAAVLLNALEYEVGTDVEYANVLEFAAGLGLNIAAGTEMTRGEAFEAMWVAVAEVPMNTEEGKTLGVVLGKLTEEVVAPTALEATVATDNLKNVVVTFNQEVDKDTVVKANFVVKLNTATVATRVELLEDNKTVVVAVDGDATTFETNGFTNQKSYTITIEKVKNLAGDVIEKVTLPFQAFDQTLPRVETLTYSGPKQMEVKFSEPVKKAGTYAVTVKSGTSTLSVNLAGITGWGTDTLQVPLFSSLVDKSSYAITFEGFEDFAGYKNVIKTFEQEYVKDVTPPTATVVKATQEYVVVEFNKPVSGLNHGLFSHTFSAWKATKLTATDVRTSAAVTEGTKFYVWFTGESAALDRPIPAGNASLTILAKQSSPAAEIVDLWGNKFAEATLSFTVVADTTAPAVKELKISAETAFTVEFTKNVTFAAANVEVLDKDGKAITGLSISVTPDPDNAKKYTVAMGKNLAGETIIITIKNVKDTTLLTNSMPNYTVTETVTDKTAPTIEKVTKQQVGTGDTATYFLYTFFDENMDSATTLVAGNYQILNGTTFTKLSNAPAFVNGTKVVKIQISKTQYDSLGGATTLFVDNVKDVAGNAITAKVSSVIVAHEGAVVPAMTAAEATARNKVLVKFGEELGTVTMTAFRALNADNSTLANPVAMDVALVEGKTQVTLTFADDTFAANTTTKKIRIVDNTLIKNLFDVTPAANAEATVVDKIAPVLITDTDALKAIRLAAGKIEIEFTEALAADASFLNAQDLVIVRGTTTLVPGVDYTTSTAGAVITVTAVGGGQLSDGVYKVSSKETITYIKDANTIKAGKFTTVKELTNTFNATAATLVINYATEATTIANTLEYRTNFAVDAWTDGAGAYSLTPGTNLQVRVKANAGAGVVAGPIQTLVVPARPALGTITIDASTNTAAFVLLNGTRITAANGYESTIDGGTNWVAIGDATTFDVSAAGTLNVRVKATATAFASVQSADLNAN